MNRYKNLYAGILVVLMTIGCCCTQPPIDFNTLNRDLLFQIQNKHIDDEALLQSISHLGKIDESSIFWTAIANDESYSVGHRSRCLMALFRRHAEFCTGLRQLAQMLAPANWLRDENIKPVDVLAGSVPVMLGVDRTVFVITVLTGSKSFIYISVLGQVSRDDFSRIIRNPDVKENEVILQYGFVDDYDDWIKSGLFHPKLKPTRQP